MIELDGIAQERLGLDRILSDRGGSASIYVKLISQITFMHPALRVPPGGNQVDGLPLAFSLLDEPSPKMDSNPNSNGWTSI